ncbi:MAG: phosphatidate cytidylyltransferase [Candidatus Omnitrophica bacterium]|nr:phosphatidate cytidylyltransferase [Candidatus Omnitrophota bacterium]
MLSTRIVSAFFILSAFFATLFFCPSWALMIYVCVFCIIAVREILTILGIQTKIYPVFYDIACLTVAVSAYYNAYGKISNDMQTAVMIMSLFVLLLINIFRYKKEEVLGTVVAPFLAVIYVTFFLTFIFRISMLSNGKFFVFYLICVVKAGDIGAFLFGRKLGKHKLIPNVSPKKTIEGAVAGFFSSIFIAFILSSLSGFSILQTLMVGITLAFLGQSGDLIESLIKRVCSVKDAGSTVPGFGGILDLIDSLLFSAPMLYYMILFIKGV